MVAWLQRLIDSIREAHYRALAKVHGSDNWAPRVNTTIAGNDCCVIPFNMQMIEKKPHVRVYRCRMCHRKHYRAIVKTGTVFGERGKVGIK